MLVNLPADRNWDNMWHSDNTYDLAMQEATSTWRLCDSLLFKSWHDDQFQRICKKVCSWRGNVWYLKMVVWSIHLVEWVARKCSRISSWTSLAMFTSWSNVSTASSLTRCCTVSTSAFITIVETSPVTYRNNVKFKIINTMQKLISTTFWGITSPISLRLSQY